MYAMGLSHGGGIRILILAFDSETSHHRFRASVPLQDYRIKSTVSIECQVSKATLNPLTIRKTYTTPTRRRPRICRRGWLHRTEWSLLQPRSDSRLCHRYWPLW
jgi:hypothetical protein